MKDELCDLEVVYKRWNPGKGYSKLSRVFSKKKVCNPLECLLKQLCYSPPSFSMSESQLGYAFLTIWSKKTRRIVWNSVSLWKRTCFPFTTRRRKLKTQQSPATWLSWKKLRQHKKLAFSNSSDLKSVFEKLTFGDPDGCAKSPTGNTSLSGLYRNVWVQKLCFEPFW